MPIVAPSELKFPMDRASFVCTAHPIPSIEGTAFNSTVARINDSQIQKKEGALELV